MGGYLISPSFLDGIWGMGWWGLFEVTWWSYVVATHPRDFAGLFGPLVVVVLCL